MAANMDGVDGEFLKAFNAAVDEYTQLTGKKVQVNSAYRTPEEQAALKAKMGNMAAAPGKSKHNHGLAIDMNSAEANEMERMGLLAKHGLARPVKNEPWHIEPVSARKQTQPTEPKVATNIDALAQQSMERNNSAVDILNNLANQQQGVISAAQATLVGTKADAGLVAETKALAEAKAASATAQFATKIGTNPDVANDALSKLIDQSNKLFEKQRAVAARLENAGNFKNLYSDPIRFAADYLLAPQNKQRYDAVTKQLDSTKNQIKWMNDATQNYRQTMNAIAQPVTVESAAAHARTIKAQVDMDVAKLDLEKLKMNGDNIMATTRMANDSLSIALRQRDQQIQEENLKIQRENQSLQAQSLKLAFEDKQEAAAAKQGFLEAVNLGRSINGELAPFRNYAELETYMKVNPQNNSVIAAQYNAGSAAKQIGQTTLASSPHAALDYVAKTGIKLDPGRQLVLDTMSRAYEEALTDPNTVKLLKDKTTTVAATNEVIAKKFTAYHADVTRGGQDNPYAPPPTQALLSDPEIAKTYFATNILTALAADTPDVSLPTAIGLLVKDMNAGKVSYNQVQSELGFLGAKIKAYNNDTRRYTATAGVPNMTKVNLPLQVPDSISVPKYPLGMAAPVIELANAMVQPTKKAVIDITDPTKVSEYLNKVRASTLKMPVTTNKTGVQ